jgi:multiple sugar transport system permease protein
MLNASLEPPGQLYSQSPSWFPLHATFEGYRSAIDSQLGHLATSLVIGGGSTLLALVVAIPAAFALAKLRLRGVTGMLFALLAVQTLPTVVMANGIYELFNRMHLLNSYLGLIIADTTLAIPFATLLLRSFIQAVPDSLVEAARVDGAGSGRILVSIILGISRNAIVTAGVFTFLFAWSDFLFALTLTTSGSVTPITLGIYLYIGTMTTDWNSVMATAVLASIPPAVILVLVQRRISAGITSGAVKG